MSLIDDFNAGHKAYYDEVPRYKNPYSESGHYDDSNYVSWEKGWDVACNEHRMFAENQRLKTENEQLGTERAEALEECIFLGNDIYNLQQILDKKERERESALLDLNDLLVYVRGLGKLSFSREKMENRVREIVRNIQEGKIREVPQSKKK